MWLLVGLGNPGASYRNHRHNIGFMAVEAIAHRHNFSDWKKKFQAELSDGLLAGEKVLLLKPQTFMNLSGQSVQAAVSFHKIPMDHVIVFHDELDLVPSKVRVKFSGGAGGHNGLRSIDEHLGADYWRVRLGIGHPGDKDLVSPYVLSNFSKEDQAWLEKLLDTVAQEAGRLVTNDTDDFMTKVAQTMQPPRENKPKENKAKEEVKKEG